MKVSLAHVPLRGEEQRRKHRFKKLEEDEKKPPTATTGSTGSITAVSGDPQEMKVASDAKTTPTATRAPLASSTTKDVQPTATSGLGALSAGTAVT